MYLYPGITCNCTQGLTVPVPRDYLYPPSQAEGYNSSMIFEVGKFKSITILGKAQYKKKRISSDNVTR